MVLVESFLRSSSLRSSPRRSVVTACQGRQQAAANRAAALPFRPLPHGAGMVDGDKTAAAVARTEQVDVRAASVDSVRTYWAAGEREASQARSSAVRDFPGGNRRTRSFRDMGAA